MMGGVWETRSGVLLRGGRPGWGQRRDLLSARGRKSCWMAEGTGEHRVQSTCLMKSEEEWVVLPIGVQTALIFKKRKSYY